MPDFVACPNCGREVAAGLTWCPFCGTELAAPASAPPETAGADSSVADVASVAHEGPPEPPPPPTGWADTAPRQATCASCGHEVDPRLTWCPHCGTRQERDAEADGAGPDFVAAEVPERTDGAASPADEASPEEPTAPPEADLPPPPARPRRPPPPHGGDAPRQAPDLQREAQRVRRSQVAGMVMSIILIIGSIAFVAVMITVLLRSGDGDEGAAPNGLPQQEVSPGAVELPDEVFTGFTPTTGDCLQYRADGEILKEDCDADHRGEVFSTIRYTPTTGPFPGNEALADFADQQCFIDFQRYVGSDYWSSGLTIVYILPTAEGWGDGDRIISCVIEDPLGVPLTGSVRDSGGIDHAGYLPFQRLTPGTCWDFPDGETELVAIHPCAEPHHAEIFWTQPLSDTDFRGGAEEVAAAEQECAARYTGYISASAADGTDWFAVVPTEFEWRNGYRVVSCVLFGADGAKLTGSAAG